MKKQQLKELIREIITEITQKKLSKLQIAYREFFTNMMDEYGVKSPVQLGNKRSEFFTRIKKEWPKERSKIVSEIYRKSSLEKINEVSIA